MKVRIKPPKFQQITNKRNQQKLLFRVLAQRPCAGQGLHAVHTRAGTYSKMALL
jgi:hypothetical protein